MDVKLRIPPRCGWVPVPYLNLYRLVSKACHFSPQSRGLDLFADVDQECELCINVTLCHFHTQENRLRGALQQGADLPCLVASFPVFLLTLF